ncbi:uncharacterized protein LOC134239479 [Saccostrea cucullata]|uniref:uncharacterized protein LOC134239479 n=1 Tax=Saccostrea cuccullata TaxID=36930 RepID=UPI002ED6AE9A
MGFFGRHCERSCTFPSYGPGCQMECFCTEDVCNPTTGCANLSEATTQLQEIVASVSTPEVWNSELRSSSISTLYSDISKKTKNIPKSFKSDRKCPPFSNWTFLGVRAQAGAMLVSIVILGALSLIIILLYMCVSLKIFLTRRDSRSTLRRIESFQT